MHQLERPDWENLPRLFDKSNEKGTRALSASAQ